ncbi:S8 family serine peptidase [candidate division WOR-3 bacterium]|nr:S8 family serine peptidase [candidate division WOR-3 bacterium]
MCISVIAAYAALMMIAHAPMTPELTHTIADARPDEMISCIVFMKETYPYDLMREYSVHDRITAFQGIAQLSQDPVLVWLKGLGDKVRVQHSYWVINGFYVMAIPSVIAQLALRSDIGWISHNGEVHAIVEPHSEPAYSSRATPWGIRKIKADSCWAAGFSGQGVIIGMCDTGVDYEHPALAGKWSGYWLDVINGQPLPYDDMTGTWHGTHCMGTICGGDGLGSFTEDIGVAPGAQYVAAKMLNSGGSGSYQQCLDGLQFMADLKDSVDIKAVSNSWGGSNGADTFFYPVMRTYISIDIMPVFANGNNGPGAATVGCPGSYSNNLGIGATDSIDAIASFSSRGPAPDQVPFNDPSTWLRDDWSLIKPQISAPGVNIRSAQGGGSGGYHNLNGTSMATPHVTGSIAIICQKNQNLTPKMIYDILLDNVDEPSQGSPYPNNTYGWGRLNVWKALNGTPTMDQPWISVLRKTMDDINPGGTGQMTVTLKNVGGAQGNNTSGVLESFDNYITIGNDFYLFGNLAPNDTANNNAGPYSYTAHALTPEGHKARIGLILHSDGPYDSLDYNDTLFYTLEIGTLPPPFKIYEDDFEYGTGIDSFLNYWDVTGNWQRTTSVAHSPTHCAFSGALVDGNVYLTLKNSIDLSGYVNPQLSVWHGYNFDNAFWNDAIIQISTNGGSTWSNIWELPFNSADSSSWAEVTQGIGTVSNNMKVRFQLFSRDFFQDYARWYIDDFAIMTPSDNEPPYFSNTTLWPDTNFTGPFPVQSIVTDQSGIDEVRLYYRVNSGSWQDLQMSHQGGGVYQSAIPQQNMDDTIDYYLWGRDTWIDPNEGTDPVGAPASGCYSFWIGTIGVAENRTHAVHFMPLSTNPTRGPVCFGFVLPSDMNVHAVVYDISGRVVRTLVDGVIKQGEHFVTWNRLDDHNRTIAAGVYFLSFQVEEHAETNRMQKLILVK